MFQGLHRPYNMSTTSETSHTEAGGGQITPKSRWCRDLEPRATWIILCCCIFPINIIIGLDTTGFGIYYVTYSQYFYNNSSTEIGFIISVKIGLLFSFSIVAGALLDRFGSRRVAITGGAICSTALGISSFAPSVLVLFLTQGVMLGIGGSFANMTTNYLTQRIFTRNRALGGGICMLGFTVGNMIGPVLIDNLISMYGWRGSLLLQAAITANIIPLAIIIPDVMHECRVIGSRDKQLTNHKPEDNLLDKHSLEDKSRDESSRGISHHQAHKQRLCKCTYLKKSLPFLKNIFDFSLFRKLAFTLAIIDGMADRFNINMVRQHMPSRAVYLGMTRTDGATFLLANGIALLFSRVLVCFVANLDGVSVILMYSTGTLLGALSSYLFVVFNSYTGQLVMSIIDGIHGGMTNTVYAVMLVELVGIQRLSKALALYGIMVGMATLTATPLGGYIYDVTSNYDIPFLLAGSVAVVGGISGTLAAMVHTHKRKVKDRSVEHDLELEITT